MCQKARNQEKTFCEVQKPANNIQRDNNGKEMLSELTARHILSI
jgi:hypothetical protein